MNKKIKSHGMLKDSKLWNGARGTRKEMEDGKRTSKKAKISCSVSIPKRPSSKGSVVKNGKKNG